MEVVFLNPTDISSRDFQRILIVKPSALGDVLHTVPVLVKLRARYPAAQIDWLLRPDIAELIRHHPALSNVVLFDRRQHARVGRSWSATAGLVKSIHGLWKNHYELAIDLHGQLRSALLTLATAAPVRIGFDRPVPKARRVELQPGSISPHRGWAGAREGAWMAYSHRIPIPTLEVHAVDRYLWLTEKLGLDRLPPDFRLYWPSTVDERADQLLREHQIKGERLAILAPGTTWETKYWHLDGFADVARDFLQKGYAVILAGTPRDRVRCQMIKEIHPKTVDLSGQTSPAELAALVQRAEICVTNDSGAMHLAVSLDRPVVSIFGPTSPLRIGPYGRPHAAVRLPLPCSPCHFRKLRDCPVDHACMKQVSSRMVIDRVQQILDARARDTRRAS
jgi:ADP-heptose:LPS heptosyltransferase